ncbi:MAG: TonB-dependent siderophore receptor, partial [Methylophaga sp.]
MRFYHSVLYLSLGLTFAPVIAAEDNTGNTLNDQNATVTLPRIGVSGDWYGASEYSGEYTRPQTNTATRMGLSIKETPQSVSIISRQV